MALSAKAEKFAQLVASGLDQTEAYIQSHNCRKSKKNTIYTNASRLAKTTKVLARIEELKKQAEKVILEHLKYDAEAHFKELNDAIKKAYEAHGKYGDADDRSAIKAIELKGKLLGLYKETDDQPRKIILSWENE
jgi:hypothetical protein